MKLSALATIANVNGPELRRLTTRPELAMSPDHVFLCRDETLPPVEGSVLAPRIRSLDVGRHGIQIVGVPELAYLDDGDVVAVHPTGSVRVLYRRASPHNSIFVTDQCNSYCLMCSQPPKPVDDGGRVVEILRLIDLIDPSTVALGVTGGEPTLFGKDFLRIVQRAKLRLPNTALHVLTNGRLFFYRSLAGELGEIGHPDLMLGIPLYSSLDWQHDHIVQARGAFEETLTGIRNLDRV